MSNSNSFDFGSGPVEVVPRKTVWWLRTVRTVAAVGASAGLMLGAVALAPHHASPRPVAGQCVYFHAGCIG